MRAPSLVGLIACFLAACSDSGTDPVFVPPNATRVEVDSVERLLHYFGGNSGIETRERMVIRDQAAWITLWDRLNAGAGVQPQVDAPVVDFDRYMVIVATMGLRHTGGFQIIVQSVHRVGADLYVVVDERGHAGCGVTQAFTEPLDGVVVPRTEGEVVFVERTSVHRCGP